MTDAIRIARSIRPAVRVKLKDGGYKDLELHNIKKGYATKGTVTDPFEIAKSVKPTKRVKKEKTEETTKTKPWESWPTTNYQSWDDVPIINPDDLVGKRVGSLEADLTRAGGHYTGIDSSQIDNPEPMLGGPGYPLMKESQENKLGWAVQGKGKGTQKLNKDMDYIAVHAMQPIAHRSNTSLVNSILGTVKAYMRDNRISPENVGELNKIISKSSKDKELKELENFPGFNSPELEKYVHSIGFKARSALVDRLWSASAENLGSPQISKVLRDTLDKEFAGVPLGHAMFLMEIPKGSSDALVNLAKEGLPIHPSYDWGVHGRIVGKFAHPVSREILHEPWFKEKLAEHKDKIAKGEDVDINAAFRRSLPVTTITQDIADKLPRAPKDIQSPKAAQLALNAFNDQWHDTDTPVKHGGLGPAMLSQALRDSDSSSTLSQYSPEDIKKMQKEGKFTGYKLKDGEVYFALKRGTNYADEYGFHHPDLTDNETALTSVVNNEPGAKGIGGAPVVLKAIQHGATVLDAYAVPTDKHPNGFLPDFYSHFGYEELGRVPFDPKYVTPQQFADMKHEWAKTGWDEKRHGLPSLAIMKWRGSDADRADAVRKFVTQGGEGFGPRRGSEDVEAAAKLAQQGVGEGSVAASGQRGISDASGNSGPVRANNAPRPSDRFTRTLAAVKGLSPVESQHFGLNPADIEQAKASGLATGGRTRRAYKKGGKVEGAVWHERDAYEEGGSTYEPHKRAEEQGYSIRGYHVTRGTRAGAISSANRFDPSRTQMPGEEATFFWDDPEAANKWAHFTAGTSTFNPSEMNEKQMDRAERHQTAIMPVRIHPGKQLEVNWPEWTGQPDYANKHMSKILRDARSQGYDTVRIKNMAEYGPMSVEEYEKAVHTGEFPLAHDQIAVLNPAMVRSEYAQFDPEKKGRDDLGARRGGGIGYNGGGEVDRTKMSHRDVTKRVPELQEAAQKLGTDEMTSEMYEALVNKHKPIRPWDHVPEPASIDEIHNALKQDQRPKIGKGQLIPEDHPVGLRLDIPAYTNHQTWVPTIHDNSTPKATVLAHEPAAHITDATFGFPEKKALNVAKGVAKSPFATIDGKWKPTHPDDIHAMAKAALNDPEWAQVGMDPERHSYFYDRKTTQPIVSAARVLQVGPLVLAHKPVYGKKEDFAFASGGKTLFEQYPTQYMPEVGRQVMAGGGTPTIGQRISEYAETLPTTEQNIESLKQLGRNVGEGAVNLGKKIYSGFEKIADQALERTPPPNVRAGERPVYVEPKREEPPKRLYVLPDGRRVSGAELEMHNEMMRERFEEQHAMPPVVQEGMPSPKRPAPTRAPMREKLQRQEQQENVDRPVVLPERERFKWPQVYKDIMSPEPQMEWTKGMTPREQDAPVKTAEGSIFSSRGSDGRESGIQMGGGSNASGPLEVSVTKTITGPKDVYLGTGDTPNPFHFHQTMVAPAPEYEGQVVPIPDTPKDRMGEYHLSKLIWPLHELKSKEGYKAKQGLEDYNPPMSATGERFPNQEDVNFYRDVDAYYGRPEAGYLQQGARGSYYDDLTKMVDRQGGYRRTMTPQESDAFNAAYIAAQRNPIAALGFRPEEFDFSGSPIPQTTAGSVLGTSSRIYADLKFPSVAVHEAIHRGLQEIENEDYNAYRAKTDSLLKEMNDLTKQRYSPEMQNRIFQISNELDRLHENKTDSDIFPPGQVGDPEEKVDEQELFVRSLMYKMFGPVEGYELERQLIKGGVIEEYPPEKLERFMIDNADRINRLEQRALKMLQERQREGGPRASGGAVRKGYAIGGNPGDMATGGYGTGISGVTGSVDRNVAAGGTESNFSDSGGQSWSGGGGDGGGSSGGGRDSNPFNGGSDRDSFTYGPTEGSVPGMSAAALDYNRKVDQMQAENNSLFGDTTNRGINRATNVFLSNANKISAPEAQSDLTRLDAAINYPLVGGMIANAYGVQQATPAQEAQLAGIVNQMRTPQSVPANFATPEGMLSRYGYSTGTTPDRAGSMGSVSPESFAGAPLPTARPSDFLTMTSSTGQQNYAPQATTTAPVTGGQGGSGGQTSVRSDFNRAFKEAADAGQKVFPWKNPVTGQTQMYRVAYQSGGRALYPSNIVEHVLNKISAPPPALDPIMVAKRGRP